MDFFSDVLFFAKTTSTKIPAVNEREEGVKQKETWRGQKEKKILNRQLW